MGRQPFQFESVLTQDQLEAIAEDPGLGLSKTDPEAFKMQYSGVGTVTEFLAVLAKHTESA